MIAEQVTKNKNTITIVAFVLVCIVLNLENIASIFHLSLPEIIRNYAHFFPLIFVAVVFLQKKSHGIEINDDELWEVKRKEALHVNNTKSMLRYSMVASVGFVFLLSNIYSSKQGISGYNKTILFSLALMIAITLIYNYVKTGFLVGYCSKGILYGYSSKTMLIIWDDLADFELHEESKTISVYCKSQLSLQKITLNNHEHYEAIKDLVSENLTYKNVTKLLTGD
mgnify:CR=1 FL=1|jgi:hypothetical protein